MAFSGGLFDLIFNSGAFGNLGAFSSPKSYTTVVDTIGGTENSISNNEGAIYSSMLIASQSGNLSHVGINLAVASGNIMVAVYSDNRSGHPAGLLSASASRMAVAGWNELTVAPISIVSGTPYWIAVQTDNDTSAYYVSESGNTYTSSWTYGTFPATGTWAVLPDAQTLNMSITY